MAINNIFKYGQFTQYFFMIFHAFQSAFEWYKFATTKRADNTVQPNSKFNF